MAPKPVRSLAYTWIPKCVGTWYAPAHIPSRDPKRVPERTSDMSDNAWLDRYRTLSSGTLGHLGSDGFLDWGIQALYRPVHMLGVALTVSCLPSDNGPLG